MTPFVPTRPRAWPWLIVLILAVLAWCGYAAYSNHQHWQATGLEEPMGSSIRNGVLAIFGVVVIAYAAFWGWSKLNQSAAQTASPTTANTSTPASTAHTSPAEAMLAQTGSRYVLEVRGLGMVVGDDTNDEVWKAIEKKADNFASILSQNPEDYPDAADIRISEFTQSGGLAFRFANRGAVEYWPVPVIIWEPSKDKLNSSRAAESISSNRQQASLGVNLFLWEDDANTDNGSTMIRKLFDFFDTHPDVPQALIFSTDSSTLRLLLRKPGSGLLPNGHIIPEIPDSVVGILVSRSDRVGRLIRPFVVEQTANVNTNTTQYDVIRLWNYYWDKNDGQGPDGFDAYFQNQIKDAGYDHPSAVGTMSSTWWQKQLPDLWKQVSNKGPGQFTPSPYIPVRWTTWQLKEFDDAPLIGYLHRPVDVRLTNAGGKPLDSAAQTAALKAGWEQAVATLSAGSEPKRVFYDTTGDRQWTIPLTRAIGDAAPGGPSLSDVKQGYDIGRRIGNTGTSSPMVQLGLGLIASYQEGGASATVDRNPDGNATIMMVSPPDAAAKAAWMQSHDGHAPYE
jgi:hypothetical protein